MCVPYPDNVNLIIFYNYIYYSTECATLGHHFNFSAISFSHFQRWNKVYFVFLVIRLNFSIAVIFIWICLYIYFTYILLTHSLINYLFPSI